jgi:hypothetical protein
MELEVDVHERLDPRPELRSGASDTLRDRANPAMAAGQQRDDPVGLAQLLGAKYDGLVAVERHSLILPVVADDSSHSASTIFSDGR